MFMNKNMKKKLIEMLNMCIIKNLDWIGCCMAFCFI